MTELASPAELPSDLTKEDVKGLARGLGLNIEDADLSEVTYRFTALMMELNKLNQTGFGSGDPLPIYAIEGGGKE